MTTTQPSNLPVSTASLDELLTMLVRAQQLQQQQDVAGAEHLYKQVITLDADGVIAQTAQKALEALAKTASESVPEEASDHLVASAQTETEIQTTGRSWLAWFYRLPVRQKQLFGLFTSEVISVGGLVLVAGTLLISGGRAQLVQQSQSELAVLSVNYEADLERTEFAFRSQADNPSMYTAFAQGFNLANDLRSQIRQTLRREVRLQGINLAMFLDRQGQVIVRTNQDRFGDVFDPGGMVSSLLSVAGAPTANDNWESAIRSIEWITWEELATEGISVPELNPGEAVLMRYVVVPVLPPGERTQVVGAVLAGKVISGTETFIQQTQSAFEGGYSAVFGIDTDQTFFMATGLAQLNNDTEVEDPQSLALPEAFLNAAVAADGEIVNRRLRVAGTNYTMAARTLSNFAGEPVAVLVRGTPEADLNRLLLNNLLLGALVVAVALVTDIYLASVLGRSIVTPVKRLQEVAQRFTQGDRKARAEVFAADEVGDLTRAFNLMAESIDRTETELEAQSRQRQEEAVFQRQEKERLQQAVVKLLLDIEGARKGDLTVQAAVDDQEMGSVADAFNATIRSLRVIVSQVIETSDQVQIASRRNEALMQHLAGETDSQAQAITSALRSVEEMEQSIRSVAQSAQAAAAIAQQALVATTEGEATMDQTVNSIENIRTSAAETAKKVKRLAESSQEISKIIGIISGISEKTNLLAFNASIEAARAGENGQGFRIVADEVRRLAERVTESTKEIEPLIGTIQSETSEVLQQMEASTSQVVTGTQLVGKTKLTLQQLGEISRQINALLQSISGSTVSQAEASALVTQTMQAVVAIATNASQESRVVSVSLQELVDVATTLQASVSKFRVE